MASVRLCRQYTFNVKCCWSGGLRPSVSRHAAVKTIPTGLEGDGDDRNGSNDTIDDDVVDDENISDGEQQLVQEEVVDEVYQISVSHSVYLAGFPA